MAQLDLVSISQDTCWDCSPCGNTFTGPLQIVRRLKSLSEAGHPSRLLTSASDRRQHVARWVTHLLLLGAKGCPQPDLRHTQVCSRTSSLSCNLLLQKRSESSVNAAVTHTLRLPNLHEVERPKCWARRGTQLQAHLCHGFPSQGVPPAPPGKDPEASS